MANQDFEQLLAIIRQINSQLDIVNQNIDRFQREFSKTGAEEFNKALANQKLVAEQLTKELNQAQQAYARLFETAKRAPGTRPGETRVEGGFEEEPASKGSRFAGAGKRAGVNYRDLRRNVFVDNSAFDRSESEIERIERERIETLRATLASELRYKNAIKIAEQQGYTIEDLKNIRTRGTGGINELQFQKYNEQGIKQNLDIFTNPNGTATPGISNQFRTFGQGVVRDIGELTKWSIALAAIYGPLRKLGDLTQEMIANQTKLAEATISVNSAFAGQAEIFNIAADAANKSGEAVSGVIDAFTAAYRATGGAGDNVTRLTTAQNLLNNSLILSKLSTLDQASAIDTLSAAVRQSGRGFDYASTLLDKWVRVTKVANVDLATLATGFATVADAAENAGLNTDELNGILAVLAESTNQSGQEVANTSRAIISGFQSDQGIKALEALGIATKDATGNMRSLKDVIQEVASLRNQKIIDDTQFSKLTLAIGQGTRRQAPTATFLENYQRAIDVANQSAQAQGDAEAALAKQLDTVQTSITRLANAFTKLAQTLGTEGGFLSIITAGTNGLTSLVNVFDKLIALLGKATPAMTAFVAASIALKYQGRGGIQQAFGGIGNSLASEQDVALGRLYTLNGNQPPPLLSPKQELGNFVGTNVLGTNALSGIFQGLLVSALPAYMNSRNKQDRYGTTKAQADVVGAVGGGVIGSLVAGSPVIGAAIGTAIAEAFVNSTVARKTDIFGYGQTATVGTTFSTSTADDKEAALKQAEINLYKSIGSGSEGLGKFLTAGVAKTSKDLVEAMNDAIKNRDKQALDTLINQKGAAGEGRRSLLAGLGITPEMALAAFNANKPLEASPERIAYNRASPQAQKEYNSALAAYNATQTGANINTPFTQLTNQNKELFGQTIATLKDISRGQLNTSRLQGNVSGAEYARQATTLGGVDTKSLQFYTAFGDTFLKTNKNVKDANEVLKIFNETIIQGGDEGTSSVTALAGEIETLYNILQSPNISAEDLKNNFGFNSIEEVRKKYDELKLTAVNTITDIHHQQQLENIKVPQLQGDLAKPYTSKEEQTIEQRTKQLQDQFYQGFLKIPDDMYTAMKKTWEDFAVAVKDSGDVFYQKVSETDQQFRQQAINQLQQQGQLASNNPFGIQQLDITSQQGAGLQSAIDYYSKYLASNFPQYQQKPEQFGVIFSDYVTDVLHGDNLAVKLALEKLVDINQKQLDGMYNIPEGATFWVPLQAAYYRPKDNGAGLPGGDASSTNTQALDANTKALQDLALSFRGDTGQSRQAQTAKEAALGFRGDPGYTRKTEADRQAALGYRGDPGYSRQQEQPSFMQQLWDSLKQFFSGTPSYPGGHGGFGGGTNAPSGFSASQTAAQQVQQPVQARLDLRFDSTTQLMVDGKMLASIITPYLASDLLNLEASQGTITKRYVI